MKRIYRILTSSIIGVIALSVLSNFVYDKFKEVPVLSAFIQFFKWVYQSAVFGLNYPMPVWSFFLFALILIISCVFAVNFLRNLPDYLKYHCDVFSTNKWTWYWKLDEEGWNIGGLTPFCSDCEIPLLNYGDKFRVIFECASCGKVYGDNAIPIDEHEEVRRQIKQKIRMNDFPRDGKLKIGGFLDF